MLAKGTLYLEAPPIEPLSATQREECQNLSYHIDTKTSFRMPPAGTRHFSPHQSRDFSKSHGASRQLCAQSRSFAGRTADTKAAVRWVALTGTNDGVPPVRFASAYDVGRPSFIMLCRQLSAQFRPYSRFEADSEAVIFTCGCSALREARSRAASGHRNGAFFHSFSYGDTAARSTLSSGTASICGPRSCRRFMSPVG